ncbi:hypothetical protein Ari01nite_48960 [Paractinoplanes rishiriensis]|uniref:CBM2 domain-containing protein n=2 Tax=Paractinoplanes rishiriensis TaxID=1050105 RepID=A0A919MRP5_9ACTN|nr:hypothetical protein Ari01nite_48960 [Actinoplanes rishiriensis]
MLVIDVHFGRTYVSRMKTIRLATAMVSGIAAAAALIVSFAATPTLAGTPGGGCSATVRIDSEWGSGPRGGQIVSVTVTNTSAATAAKWAVSWPLVTGQRVRTAWNATVSTTGSTATAVNTRWNGTLAAGAATTFGMQLDGVFPPPALTCDNGTTPPPPAADFTVTELDNTRTVTLRVGQTLAVNLSGGYRKPDLTGTALTELSSSGGGTTGQPLTVLYRAAADGSETLHSDTEAGALWRVAVNVVGVPPSGGGQTVVVTATNNQGSTSLAVGDTLVVSLPGNYVPPALSAEGVLSLAAVSGGYPTADPLLARYVANAPGQVDLSSITDAACRHQPTPCPSPQVRWLLHATVTG